jgi:tripartite-type tricarboxylate transporter receptor subunit TctC
MTTHDRTRAALATGHPIGRRGFHRVLAGTAAAALGGGGAWAADYPVRPIHVIVPFVPGGAADLVGREIGKNITEQLHQNVLTENHGGGNTIIGTTLVARSRPDGYTVLLASNTFALNPTLRPNLPYDTAKDFTPVAIAAVNPFLLVVHPSVPAKTLAEFIAYAKAHPGAVNFGTAGIGSGNHLATELFMVKAGVKLTLVPYQGSGAYMVDLLAGRLQMAITPVSLTASLIRTGQLRALGIGEPERLPSLPDIPTIAEAGVPGYAANEWVGFVVRAGTPSQIVDTLNAAVQKAVNDPEVVAAFSSAGSYPRHTTPEQANQFIVGEIAKWHEVITTADIKLNEPG